MPGAPVIASFTAPSPVTSGKTATLTWSVTGATALSLTLPDNSTQAVTGTSFITPTLTATAPTTLQWRLTATGPGGSASQTVTLTVQPWAPSTVTVVVSPGSTFDLRGTLPPDVTPGGTFSVSPAGAQLPACLSVAMLAQGVIGVGSCMAMPDTTGVIFIYDEP